MNEAESRLAADRSTRRSARGLFDRRLGRLKDEITEHGGVGGVIRHEAERKLDEAADYGLAVARESKGVVAATLAALALWFFRRPLLDKAKALLGQDTEPAQVQDHGANALPSEEEPGT
jgi:hypothetical protein